MAESAAKFAITHRLSDNEREIYCVYIVPYISLSITLDAMLICANLQRFANKSGLPEGHKIARTLVVVSANIRWGLILLRMD